MRQREVRSTGEDRRRGGARRGRRWARMARMGVKMDGVVD